MVPPGTTCKQPCDKNCRSTNPRNPTDAGFDDIHCNEMVSDNRMNFHRCNASGAGVNESWRFDLEMPCTVQP